MSIAKRWSSFNWAKLGDVPDVYGVFELRDSTGNIIYIGEGRMRDELQIYKRNARATAEWSLLALNTQSHQLEATSEITYYNGTTYNKIVQPVQLNIVGTEQT